MFAKHRETVDPGSTADIEQSPCIGHGSALGQHRRDIFRTAGERHRQTAGAGLRIHGRFNPVAVDVRHTRPARIAAGRAIGSQPLNHLLDPRARAG